MKKYLTLLAAILIVAACGKEEPTQKPGNPSTPDQETPEIQEPQLEQLNFKACLSEQASDIESIPSWKEGDAIAFFWDGTSSTIDIDEVKDTVKFTQEVKSGTYYELYPI